MSEFYLANLSFEINETDNKYDSGIFLGQANNQAPIVNAGEDRLIDGLSTMLNGVVNDDGVPSGGSLSINWGKVSGRGEAVFGNPTMATTAVTFSQTGRYVLRLSASDGELSGSDEVEISINGAPTVNAGTDQTVTLAAGATLTGMVNDDGVPANIPLVINWSKISGPGTVTFSNGSSANTTTTFSEVGTYVLRLEVSDTLLSSSDEVTITVIAMVAPPPSVSIVTPMDGVTIATPTDIVGNVSNGSWKLAYSLNGDDEIAREYTTIATGSGAVNNGVLGRVDTTLMLNGTYVLRLITRDEQDRIAIIESSIIVDRNLKVGNFTISFNELSVPVAGIPIQVIRTYDTRDRRQQDFGAGWSLSIKNVRLEKSSNLGKNWQE